MHGDAYCEFNQCPAHNPPMSDHAGISLACRENAGTQRPTEQSAESTVKQGPIRPSGYLALCTCRAYAHLSPTYSSLEIGVHHAAPPRLWRNDGVQPWYSHRHDWMLFLWKLKYLNM